MLLQNFPYISVPEEMTPEGLLLANGRPKTLAHVQEVAEVCAGLAERFGLEVERCRLAGMLHDISAVIRPADMLCWAQREDWELCEAERKYPFLLHQRLSAVVAREAFGVTDEKVLSAIRCHTTLRASASGEDLALFIADKIAWDQPGEPPYLEQVMAALEQSLEQACLVYMTWTADSGKLLCPHSDWTSALRWLQR